LVLGFPAWTRPCVGRVVEPDRELLKMVEHEPAQRAMARIAGSVAGGPWFFRHASTKIRLRGCFCSVESEAALKRDAAAKIAA